MTTLTVALTLSRPTAGTEFSYVLGDGGQVPTAQGVAAVALLPRAEALVLVVPARALSWHSVKLPPSAAGRQRAALEGLLEDRLLDEPPTLAFALAPRRGADGSTLVAVCDRSWLTGILQLFDQAGRPAGRVVPELAPLPAGGPHHRQLVVSGTPNDAWLTVVDGSSVVCVPLTQARPLLDLDSPGADGIALVAEPAVADLAEHLVGRTATVRPAPVALLASGQTDWELAQYELATSGRGRMARRWVQAWRQLASAPRWRAARWGLAAMVLANLAGLNAWAWRLDGSVLAKRAQVRQILTQAFPNVRTVVDAPLQMEREVALLRQSSGALSARDLESMLSALGSAVPDGQHAVGLEYFAGQLTVKGLVLSPEQVDRVSGKLSAQGYAARQESGRFVVRAGARP